ncbi:MAG: hypothetical protein MRECE_5c014 [Mycoplasmataceae bacterium CE_OT135]|nr:MAG: hypothetical protein MRECE_5c014 [Mycoplasmataceae bacterium CE_OT135]
MFFLDTSEIQEEIKKTLFKNHPDKNHGNHQPKKNLNFKMAIRPGNLE